MQIAAASFFVTFLMSLLLSPLSHKLGLVDHPNERKLHTRRIPLVGGWAMYLAIVASFLWFHNLSFSFHDIVLLFAASLLVLTGSIDDRFDLSYKLRIGIQVFAACLIVYGAGIYVSDFGNLLGFGVIGLGALAALFTIWAVMGLVNAYNMIDGIDGLAAGMGLVAITFVYVATSGQIPVLESDLLLLIMGALCAYLIFNLDLFPKQLPKIFMGDAGSMLLGFAIAVIMVRYSQGAERVLWPVTTLWFISIPVVDVFVTMSRRIKNGMSPFKPDRTHIHHVFQKAGYTNGRTLFVILSVQFALASIGLMIQRYVHLEWVSFVGICLVFALYFQIMVRSKLVVRLLAQEFHFFHSDAANDEVVVDQNQA